MEGGGGRGRSERASNRTIYVLPATKDPKDTPKPTPVQIKVGISDGISTEVLEGLEEGAQVLTGTITTGDTATARAAGGSSNPFGGGGGFGGGGFRPRF